MANDAIAEVLKGALAKFDGGKKWCIGNFEDNRGRMCAQGAVIRQMHPEWTGENDEAWEYVYGDCGPVVGVLYDNMPEGGSEYDYFDVGSYNNSRNSFAEIREWFERAIASRPTFITTNKVETIDIDELLGEKHEEVVHG
jgi:hypothetical protein